MSTINTREGILIQNIENAVQLTYTNATGTAMVVGEVIGIKGVAGKRIAAMVLEAIANGSSGQVLIEGRVNVKKNTSRAFTQGADVYWDVSANQADTSAVAAVHGDFVVGRCSKAAAASASHVEVDLNRGSTASMPSSSSSSSSSSS